MSSTINPPSTSIASPESCQAAGPHRIQEAVCEDLRGEYEQH